MAEVIFRGRRLMLRSAIVAVIGFVLLAIGLAVDPERAWLSYLMAFVFVFTISIGGLILLMIAYATNARWMAVVRRPCEAVTLPLPALAVLFVPLLFGLDQYPWQVHPPHLPHHELEILEHREPFMNPTAFVIRAVIYFVVFLVAAGLLRRWSVRRDVVHSGPIELIEPPAPEEVLSRERRLASGMLPAVGLAFTFAIFDWVMSLETVWYSTIFGVYLFAGGFLAAIALVTIMTERLHRRSELVTRHHFHALGRLLFAFTVFWTYAAFFQAMLIRIANKPEEVTFYLDRIDGAWRVFVYVLILGHFALPFLFLLPRRFKFVPRAMAIAGGWLVAMHLVDIYWIVIPSRVQGVFVFHWLDLGALAAVVGTAVAVAAWRQTGVAMFAERDPFLAKGAAYRSNLL